MRKLALWIFAGLLSGCVNAGNGAMETHFTVWRSNDTSGDSNKTDTSMGSGGSLSAEGIPTK